MDHLRQERQSRHWLLHSARYRRLARGAAARAMLNTLVASSANHGSSDFSTHSPRRLRLHHGIDYILAVVGSVWQLMIQGVQRLIGRRPARRHVLHMMVVLLTIVMVWGEGAQLWSSRTLSPWQNQFTTATGGTPQSVAISDSIVIVGLHETTNVAASQAVEATDLIAPGLQVPLPENDPAFQDVHQVVDGETLGQIADRYNITLQSLIWSNGLQGGDALATGQELRIPRMSGLPYIVQEGDTLESIAERFAVSPDAILLFKPNMLQPSAELPVSRELFIPGGSQPLPEDLLSVYGGEDGLAARQASPVAFVDEDRVNIREGPNVEYEQVARFGVGRHAQLLARHADWFKVDIAGTVGWVRGDLLEIPTGLSETVPETNDFPSLPPKWAWPTHGSMTSYFGPRWGSFHDGVDIANRAWTPIVAARTGVVIESGWCSGYGYCVKINHDGGMQTIYGHLIDQPVAVVGEQVTAGQLIGHMGSTYDARGGGYSTGVHLHFTIKVNGRAVDPLQFLP